MFFCCLLPVAFDMFLFVKNKGYNKFIGEWCNKIIYLLRFLIKNYTLPPSKRGEGFRSFIAADSCYISGFFET